MIPSKVESVHDVGNDAVAMKRELVAPCGMNCNLCSWVLDPAKPGPTPYRKRPLS